MESNDVHSDQTLIIMFWHDFQYIYIEINVFAFKTAESPSKCLQFFPEDQITSLNKNNLEM